MKYPKEFISLVNSLANETDQDLQYIGQGNPWAKMLIVEKDNHIDTSTTRGEGCYMMEVLNNVKQWQKNIEENVCSDDVTSWIESPISIEAYNPLYPYKGLKNFLAKRDSEGSSINGGVSSSWVSYQKLRSAISPASESDVIDFHQTAFLTSLCSVKCPNHGYPDEVRKSVSVRCKQLFSLPYFRSFDVILMSCGRIVKDCHVNIEEVFDQKFVEEIKYGNEWIRYYEKDGKLLMLTGTIQRCSKELIGVIGKKAREYLMRQLMPYFVHYDGTEDSINNDSLAWYEYLWSCLRLIGKDSQYDFEVNDMINNYGFEEDWLDSFELPRTLIGLFFNRYCHWLNYADKDGFKSWFEKYRKGITE